MIVHNLTSAKRNADKKTKAEVFQSKSHGAPTESQNHSMQGSLQRIQTSGLNPLQMKQQDILALQRIIGNRAVVQLLGQQHHAEGIHKAAAKGVEGSGGKLPHYEKIQESFGHHDVSHVQAYIGEGAAAANKAIGAEAYATGSKIAFSNGNPDLHTAAHEAAHIVQQQAGIQLKGGVGEAGDKYERQADQVADLVVQGKSAEAALSEVSTGSAEAGGHGGNVMPKPAVQCVFRYKSGRYMSEEVAEMIRNLWRGTEGFGAFVPLAKEGFIAGQTFEDWFAINTGGLSKEQIGQINELVLKDPGRESVKVTESEPEIERVKETGLSIGVSDLGSSSKEITTSPVTTKQISIKLDKSYYLTISSEDEKDVKLIREKMYATLKKNVGQKFNLPPEVLVIRNSGKELPRSGPVLIEKDSTWTVTIDLNRKAKSVEEAEEDQLVDNEIMALADAMHETVIFSYVNTPSIEKLEEQQNLKQLRAALKGGESTLKVALIDPNFADQDLSKQVVAELEKELSIKFKVEAITIGGAKAHRFTYGKVTVVYVGKWLNKGTQKALEEHDRARMFSKPSRL